jgi:predicted membrane chloride channel (bestrophin family)
MVSVSRRISKTLRSSQSLPYPLLIHKTGSALCKAVTPSILSSIVFVLLWKFANINDDDAQLFFHPYPIGALIGCFTFMLAFRANFSYNRWWEAMTSVYQMHSKWCDVAMELAAFHLQSEHYRKPPAFGAHPELTCLVERERERRNATTLEELENQLDEMIENKQISSKGFHTLLSKRKNTKDMSKKSGTPETKRNNNSKSTESKSASHKKNYGIDWLRSKLITKTKGAVLRTANKNVPKAWEDDSPPLFLQEAAHLLSLLSAVAMSTLRNDLEEAGSPLMVFTPGAPFPHVDPDEYGADVRKDWNVSRYAIVSAMRFMLGTHRNSKSRTLYNAARPFRVIGDVSDAEVEMLQAARGPLAKVALCTMWLEEFICREYMSGSTGKVSPPIISRLFQFISDGMLGYNHARKIAYIPFPFPHAQITSFFVLVVMCLIPVLMLSYLDNEAFGFVLNFLTVLCFSGLHEVSRELEAPFMNAPNDIPLNNFQAQFNESLITMFFGCHPDAYWELHEQVEEVLVDEKEAKNDEDVSHKEANGESAPMSVIAEQ